MTVAEEPPPWHSLAPNPYNPHAWIVGAPVIGPNCWIGAFTVIDGSGGLTIGSGCEISAGAQIYTHSTVRRVLSGGNLPIDRSSVEIGANVHIGAGAVILMGSRIGDHSVIGAGCVILQHTLVPPWSVVTGVPGRIREGRAREMLKLTWGDDVNVDGEQAT